MGVAKSYSVIIHNVDEGTYRHAGNYKTKMEAIGRAILAISEFYNCNSKKQYRITPYREDDLNGEIKLLWTDLDPSRDIWETFIEALILPYFECEDKE